MKRRETRTDTRRRNVAMLAAGVLFLLVMVTTSIVTGMLARYATGDDSGDVARVAKFSVTGSGFSSALDISAVMEPGQTLDYTGGSALAVTNNSEVSVRCTITLRNTTRNLPLALKVGSSETDQTTGFNSNTGYSYTMDLAANQSTPGTFAFKIVWPTTPAENRSPVYSGQLDNIRITVTAEQID